MQKLIEIQKNPKSRDAMRHLAQNLLNTVDSKKLVDQCIEEVAYTDDSFTVSMLVGMVFDRIISQTVKTYNLDYETYGALIIESALTTYVSDLVLNSELIKVNIRRVKKGTEFVNEQRVSFTFETNENVNDRNKFIDVEEHQDLTRVKGWSMNLDTRISDHLDSVRTGDNHVKLFDSVDEEFIGLHSFLMMVKELKANPTAKISQVRKFHNDMLEQTLNSSGTAFRQAMKSSSSNRLYPLNRYGYSKPYGTGIESRLFVMATERPVSALDIEEAKRLASVIVYGRMPFQDALKKYNQSSMTRRVRESFKLLVQLREEMVAYEQMLPSQKKKYVPCIDHKDLGEIYYFNGLIKLIRDGRGEPSDFMLEADATNMGLMTLSVNVGSNKLLKLGNMLSDNYVADSHGTIKESLFNIFRLDSLTRNEVKKSVSQSLFHGGAVASMVKGLPIPDTADSIEKLDIGLTDAFGSAYKLPNLIAKWGQEILTANPNKIYKVKAPDGVISFFHGYGSGGAVEVMTTNGRAHIYRDLPLRSTGGKMTNGIMKSQKALGLYATVFAHSFDSYLMREYYSTLGIEMDILDKVKGTGEQLKAVRQLCVEKLNEHNDWFMSCISQLESQTEVECPQEIKDLLSEFDGVAVNTNNMYTA